jgi:hypothetical protein
VSYRYIAPGTCLLHVKNVTLQAGKMRVVGTLPMAYRPSADRIGVVSDGSHVGILFARVTGSIELYAAAAGDYSGFVVY